MKKHVSVVAVVALATVVLAGIWVLPGSADANRYRVFVYPDRTRPEAAVVVEDFRVNETVWAEGGVQYLWVRGPAGSFKVFFSELGQIEVIKFVGLTQVDWARYEVKVTEKNPDIVRYGTLDVRVMRGVANGEEWYYYPAATKERGTKFWRFVVGDQSAEPTIPLGEPPAEAAAVAIVPAAPPLAPAPTPATAYDRLTLDDLNAQNPLCDIFFDFDRDTVRPDSQESLKKNADWLREHPSAVVRVDGYADPRGSREYNLELAQRRAEATRRHLIALGVPANQLVVAARGAAQEFCSTPNEDCWARNRRSHFVFTAK
jgi:peptidoglycan-associated lipoprotein